MYDYYLKIDEAIAQLRENIEKVDSRLNDIANRINCIQQFKNNSMTLDSCTITKILEIKDELTKESKGLLNGCLKGSEYIDTVTCVTHSFSHYQKQLKLLQKSVEKIDKMEKSKMFKKK